MDILFLTFAVKTVLHRTRFFATVLGFTSDIFLKLECLGHLACAFKMLTGDTLKKILTGMVSFP